MSDRLAALVVEDDESSAMILAEVLRNEVGVDHVDRASDGDAAWSRLQENQYDLVISDWNMPGKDGRELLNLVRNDRRFADLPFLMITGRSDTDSVRQALALRVNGYVLKPFDSAVIAKKVRKALGLPESTPGIAVETQAPASERTLVDKVLERFKAGRIEMPVLPRIYLEIEQALQRDDVSLTRISRTIETDPAITARVISVANSPVYQGYGKHRTLEQAISRLGLRHARDIVLTISQRALFRTELDLFSQRMEAEWERSLGYALCARMLSKRAAVGDPDELYTAGLLYNVGRLLLLRVLDGLAQDGEDLGPDAIDEVLELLHVDLAKALFNRWRFSSQFRDICFGTMASAGGVYRREMLLANVARGLMDAGHNQDDKQAAASVAGERPAKVLELQPALLETVASETRRQVVEFKAALD